MQWPIPTWNTYLSFFTSITWIRFSPGWKTWSISTIPRSTHTWVPFGSLSTCCSLLSLAERYRHDQSSRPRHSRTTDGVGNAQSERSLSRPRESRLDRSMGVDAHCAHDRLFSLSDLLHQASLSEFHCTETNEKIKRRRNLYSARQACTDK